MIYSMNLTLNLLNKPYLTKMRMILPHIQPFNPHSILLNLKIYQVFISLINTGKRFLRKLRSLPLKLTRRLKWSTLKNTQHLVTLNPNHLLLWVNLILNPSKFIFMTIIFHLITHLKMWIIHVISVTPPAPLKVCMNQVH